MPIEICKKEMCTGCFACMNICPRDAIQRGEDACGKTIPAIDKEKCIECGLCVKTCPANKLVEFHIPIKCYAAWGKDEKDREGCSSGGIATVLSKAVVDEGGIVYGAAFNDDLELQHMGVQTKEEIEKLKGSKYVQSYTGLTFRNIKENLMTGRKVLFIGTPCQVEGLKSYLKDDYENLILVDIVCHGTPPMKYLKEYLEIIDQRRKTRGIAFRGKKDYYLTLYGDEQEFYSKKSNRDYYFYSFLKGLIHRDNCYSCKYAKAERCSDITIGDFWGLKKEELESSYRGKVSVVLINTHHGEKVWDVYKDKYCFEERKIQEAVEGNGQLRRPSLCHPDREKFIDSYKKEGFLKAIKSTSVRKEIKVNKLKATIVYRVIRWVAKKIRNR